MKIGGSSTPSLGEGQPTDLSATGLALGLPIRNVATFLPRLMEVLLQAGRHFLDVRVVLAENDSHDSTGAVALDLSSSDHRISVLQFPGLSSLVPGRTDRLAFLRNSIVEELLASTDSKNRWVAVFVDADQVSSEIEVDDVLSLVRILYDNPQFFAAAANSSPAYYDIWALRSDDWSPDDCWTRVAQRPTSVSYDAAVRTFVGARQRVLDPSGPVVPVSSAFGGLAVYRLDDITSCRYAGQLSDGSACSEHIPFNSDLCSTTGNRLAIVPSVMLVAPEEHLVENQLGSEAREASVDGLIAVSNFGDAFARSWRASSRRAARRVRDATGLFLSREQTKGDRARTVDEFQLVMETNHALPRYVSEFRAYDRPVRSIGLVLRRSYGRRIRAVDIGANIGDTAVALVVATGADVLAIEGDKKFLSALRANTAPLADRVVIVDRYVTANGSVFQSSAKGSGTARLVTGPRDAPFGESHITTSCLADELSGAGWYATDLLKSDTDGHDFELIGAALTFEWIEPPVLFFEFDPFLDAGGGEAGLALVEAGLSKGYCRWYVWDNFGNLLGLVERNHVPWFKNLVAYLERCKEAGGGLYYVDVAAFCAFHPPYDGLVNLRHEQT